MNAVFFLSNFYDGPLKGQGPGQGAKPGHPVHPWHWLKETDQGWESMPLARAREAKGPVRWSRLSEQIFRVDKWSACRG